MRVLHVTPYFAPAFQYGGPPRSVLGLCKGLQHAGIDVEVLTTTANGQADFNPSPPPGVEYEGVRVHYVRRGFPRRLFGGRLRKPLTEALERVDVCHVHGLWNIPEWRATSLARAQAVPYVLSPRGMLQPGALRQRSWRKQIAYSWIERSSIRDASLLHATSDAEAAVLRRHRDDDAVIVAPNGVTVPPASASSRFRERQGISRDAFVIIFLGRIHPIKRIDLLIAAFEILRADNIDVHLVIAGPDERGDLAGLMRSVEAHADRVHATGALDEDEKWEALRDADVAVQCSDSESFGLAIVEAMAAGLPVVVSRTCPWPEIETRQCGFWVEQSSSAIANAIGRMVTDRPAAIEMGERAAAFARERFGWDRVARLLADAYADVLARARQGRVA